jgi:hypothetical protein
MTAYNPNFFLLRLRHSSFRELFFRIRQFIVLHYLKLLTKLGWEFPKIAAIKKSEIEKLIMPDLIPEPEINHQHRLDKMNLEHLLYPRNLEPEGAETDIRMLWEPARLQQAVILLVYAHEYRESKEWKKAGQAVKTMILSWLSINPFLRRLYYQSAMECALRVPVFFYALKRLDKLTNEEYDQILKAIYQHGWLVSKKLSLYSSLGNHTIAEAVGLVFAGAVYRSTYQGKDWLSRGIKLLNDELQHQILEDGGPLEQSLSYHRFVLDLYWLAIDFIQKNNLGDVHHWETRLTAGELFLCAFKDQIRLLPAIGDSDDGHAVAPGIAPIRFAGADCSKNLITFAESGYTLIRNEKMVFTFDHGSLGMAPLYNHGHADALSITLAKNGHPFLIDPGTYRYNGVPQWRRYYKGTRAHNTVTIDDLDQAVYETGFIWSKPYRAELAATESEKNQHFFIGVHNGYTRLEDPVHHYRSILFFDEANLLIRDSFSGTGRHKFQLNYHLHPDVTIDQAGKWWVLENHGESVFLKIGDGFLKPVKGTQNPIMGWFSSRYGEKEPTTVLTCNKRGIANEVTFVTAIFTLSPFYQ